MKFELIDPADYTKNLKPVTSPNIFLPGSRRFDPEGLFSPDIFGVPGSESWSYQKAYIDLRDCGWFIHPYVYNLLKTHARKIYSALIGQGSLKFEDGELKLTETGDLTGPKVFTWLLENLDEVPISDNLKTLLQKYKNSVKIHAWFVLPPAFRDLSVFKDKISSKSVLNVIYADIIRLSKRLALTPEDLENMHPKHDERFPIWLAIQEKLYECFKEEENIFAHKEGLIRQHILGKRLDFTARAVITVNPNLPHDTVAIPYKLAAKLFEPWLAYHLLHSLDDDGVPYREKLERILKTPITAKTITYITTLFRDGHLPEEAEKILKEILEKYCKDKAIILKRDPALHRLSLQAFKYVFTDDYTIQIPPLVTDPYNADFDGDQMAIYVPLTEEAIEEAKQKLTYQVINPGNASISYSPKQDVVLGIYLLTLNEETGPTLNLTVTDNTPLDKLIELLKQKGPYVIVTYKGDKGKVTTTLGRVIYNLVYPPFIFDTFFDQVIRKKDLKNHLQHALYKTDKHTIIKILDRLTEIAGIVNNMYPVTITLEELNPPEELIERIQKKLKSADLLEGTKLIKLAMEEIKKWLKEQHAGFYYLIDSGARGSWTDIQQMLLAKGFVTDPNGRILNEAIVHSYIQGLTPEEFFKASVAAIKGSMDRSINTAKSGYLSRQLTYVAANVYIAKKNCHTDHYFELILSDPKGELSDEEFAKLFLFRNTDKGMITPENYKRFAGKRVKLYSPIFCKTYPGVCENCYGTYYKVLNSKQVGIVAAQALGERMTQLMMKTFHTGGVAELSEIPQILPKEEKVHKYLEQVGTKLIAKVPLLIKFNPNTTLYLYQDDVIFIKEGLVYIYDVEGTPVTILEIHDFGLDIPIVNPEKVVIEDSEIRVYTDAKQPFANIVFITQDMSTQAQYIERIFNAYNIKTWQELYWKILHMVKKFGLLSVHVEIFVAQMTRNKENPFIPMRLKPDEPYIIVGKKQVPYLESPLLGLAFENPKRALFYALLSSKESTNSFFEKILLNEF